MSIKTVKFYFNQDEAGRPVLTKATEGHKLVKAPHAAEALTHIFDTLKSESNSVGQKIEEFKKFTATLNYPSRSSNFALKIARNDKRLAIHIKSLKQETAALLTNELSPLRPSLIKNSKGKISSFKRKNVRPSNELTPLLNRSPAPQRSCIDIIYGLVNGLISLISKICNRSNMNESSAHPLPVVIVPEEDEEDILERFNAQRVVEALEDEISKWQEASDEMTQSRWPFQLDPVYHTLNRQIAENSAKIARLQSKINPLQAARYPS
jgi:hypothetical protein